MKKVKKVKGGKPTVQSQLRTLKTVHEDLSRRFNEVLETCAGHNVKIKELMEQLGGKCREVRDAKEQIAEAKSVIHNQEIEISRLKGYCQRVVQEDVASYNIKQGGAARTTVDVQSPFGVPEGRDCISTGRIF
jgi:chromosome segregation ATPase